MFPWSRFTPSLRESGVRRAAIIGAGISGLSLGWFLRQRGVEVTLFEKSDRAGGYIQTIEKEGFLFEKGPRSLKTNAIETLKLVEALGLQDQVVCSKTLGRYLYVEGKLQKMPQNPLAMLFSKLTRKHLWTILREGWKPKKTLEDESIYDFARRRYNAAFAEAFFDPLVSGIFAGDMEKLSVRACLPSLYNLEQEWGSLLKGMLFSRREKPAVSSFVQKMQQAPLFSFRSGLETLPRELSKRLNIRWNRPVAGVHCRSDCAELTFADQTQETFDHVFSAIPLESLKTAPLTLPIIPRAGVAAVHLGYRSERLPYAAFGYLIPRSEKERVLGVVFDSCVFPSQQGGKLALTVMIKMAEGCAEEHYIGWALEAVKRHLGMKEPDVAVCSLNPHAIPQYPVGYQKRVVAEAARSGRLTILGSTYYGVSVSDCIAKAKSIAESCK